MDAARQPTIYDAVRQLRPEWLQRRAETAILVYVDGQEAGNASVLHRLSVTTAQRIAYLSPTEAQIRFGNRNHNRAAILIETERQ